MKVLIVRFSSIGDIVLTTPVVRCVKEQIPNVEVHYLTKIGFKIILEDNPHIDKIWTIKDSINEVVENLKKEKFDYLIDLHNNIRTVSLKAKLRVKSFTFNKINIQKWMLVNFKRPIRYQGHVVDRYFETVKKLGVKNDQLPGEFFIPKGDEIDLRMYGIENHQYIAVAVGSQFETKEMPVELLIDVLKVQKLPIILLGYGARDNQRANEIEKAIPVIDLTSQLNLNSSAYVVKNCKVLLTGDTGLMHIGACFPIKIVSVWGNTVPEFGMYPYLPQSPENLTIHEVKDLDCRPCSKIGYHECPKGHFNCMMLQDKSAIANAIKKFSEE